MAHFDVFNGDADGICALQQLRLASPSPEAKLITGVKREIDLLRRVEAQAGDSVTVLDISLDKNREPLLALLAKGVAVEYFDHHYAGEIPAHAALAVHIDTSPQTCTSLLVNDHLAGAHRAWAVVGAFGDNFHQQARRAAEPLGLNERAIEQLSTLGTCLNYNGYGVSLEDLWFAPDALYRALSPYVNPLAFVQESEAYRVLHEGYLNDMENAAALAPELAGEGYALYLLPDAPWARRVSGVLGNDLARAHPRRAHALLTLLPDGAFRISIRAPLANPTGADTLCRQFATGGGRAAAAGINRLPTDEFDRFAQAFQAAYHAA